MSREARLSLDTENKNHSESTEKVKIYILPNLMTLGNLICGYMAIVHIFNDLYRDAIGFILFAFLFDFFDGRIARLGGQESPFGREFDSIADIVSFGVAPAFLVTKQVLSEFPHIGQFVALIYLACGAVRLARFNVLATIPREKQKGLKEFTGFPIPAAAGLVVSLTLLMLYLTDHAKPTGPWRFPLLIIMLIVSGMMVSEVKYPSFKNLNWTLQKPLVAFLIVVVMIVAIAQFKEVMLAVIFVSYLLYGGIRPWVSKQWRREIEIEGEEDETDERQKPELKS